MIRIFFFLLGFGLSVIGFMYMLLYLNLLSMGYTKIEYIAFIMKQSECIIGIIGIIMISLTIFYKGRKNGIHI